MNSFGGVVQDLTLDEYREMAELFHQIGYFGRRSEQNARELGLNAELHLLLLTVQGLPEGARPTIAAVTDRLCVEHDTVSELVDQAVRRMELIRSSDPGDGRDDWVKLTKTGRETLRQIALANRGALEQCAPELVGALQSVTRHRRRKSRTTI